METSKYVERIVNIVASEHEAIASITGQARNAATGALLKVCKDIASEKFTDKEISGIFNAALSRFTWEKSTFSSNKSRMLGIVESFRDPAFSCPSNSLQMRYAAWNKYKGQAKEQAKTDKIEALKVKIEADNAALIALAEKQANANSELEQAKLAMEQAKKRVALANASAKLAAASIEKEKADKVKAEKSPIPAFISAQLKDKNISQKMTTAQVILSNLGAALSTAGDEAQDNKAQNVGAILAILGTMLYNGDADGIQAVMDAMQGPAKLSKAS